jgi:7-alpha-hydroxysteroid dehydrogenase
MKVQELFSLRDQAALVTGAGAGIGKAISLLFAEAGASVACTDRDGEQAQVVAEECRRFGGKAIGLALDVTDESQRVDVVDQVVRQLGICRSSSIMRVGEVPSHSICHWPTLSGHFS